MVHTQQDFSSVKHFPILIVRLQYMKQISLGSIRTPHGSVVSPRLSHVLQSGILLHHRRGEPAAISYARTTTKVQAFMQTQYIRNVCIRKFMFCSEFPLIKLVECLDVQPKYRLFPP